MYYFRHCVLVYHHCVIIKKDLPQFLQKVINETTRPEIFKKGFKASGIFPWNLDQIYFRKCLGKKGLTSTEKNIIIDAAQTIIIYNIIILLILLVLK